VRRQSPGSRLFGKASPKPPVPKPKFQSAKQYILFNKPYAVLCQFSPEGEKQTLKDFLSLPKDVYPVGRLDFETEGLLLLTNDNDIKNQLTNPKFGHPKTYLAQVEKNPTEEALSKLRQGVVIDGAKTKPAEVELLEREPELLPRPIPIRFRKNIPTAWLKITIREGRNRQVRKMTAAAGHPTLRLARIGIAKLELGGLKPGEKKAVRRKDIF
jgi:23S rRNA pseudouridine2457 synthase